MISHYPGAPEVTNYSFALVRVNGSLHLQVEVLYTDRCVTEEYIPLDTENLEIVEIHDAILIKN